MGRMVVMLMPVALQHPGYCAAGIWLENLAHGSLFARCMRCPFEDGSRDAIQVRALGRVLSIGLTDHAQADADHGRS